MQQASFTERQIRVLFDQRGKTHARLKERSANRLTSYMK